MKDKRIKELEEELEKTKSELGICQARLSIVERKYLKECTDEDLCKSKQKIIDNLEAEIKKLKEEIDIYRQSIHSLNQQQLQLEATIKSLTAQNKELKEKLKSTSSQDKNEYVKELEEKLRAALNDNLLCTQKLKQLEESIKLSVPAKDSPSPVAASSQEPDSPVPPYTIEVSFDKMILLTQALLQQDCLLVFNILFQAHRNPHPSSRN